MHNGQPVYREVRSFNVVLPFLQIALNWEITLASEFQRFYKKHGVTRVECFLPIINEESLEFLGPRM